MWWYHDREMFPALLAFREGNPPITSNGPVMQSFNIFFVVSMTKLSNKQWSYQWFETLWHPCNMAIIMEKWYWQETHTNVSWKSVHHQKGIFQDFCARRRYQGWRQVIASHTYNGIWLLVTAPDTLFWHNLKLICECSWDCICPPRPD